jgi:hypothetical protein
MAAQDYEQVTYNGPAGAQLGQSATEKIALHGATPVVQRSGSAQGALTLTTATTAGFGFSTSTAFNSATALLVEIRAALVEKGIIAGS